MRLKDLLDEVRKKKDEEDPNKFGDREYYVLIKYNNRRTNVNNTLNLDAIDDDVRTLMRKYRANKLTTTDIRGWYQVNVQGFGTDARRAEKFARDITAKTDPYSAVVYTVGYDEMVKTIRA